MRGTEIRPIRSRPLSPNLDDYVIVSNDQLDKEQEGNQMFNHLVIDLIDCLLFQSSVVVLMFIYD